MCSTNPTSCSQHKTNKKCVQVLLLPMVANSIHHETQLTARLPPLPNVINQVGLSLVFSGPDSVVPTPTWGPVSPIPLIVMCHLLPQQGWNWGSGQRCGVPNQEWQPIESHTPTRCCWGALSIADISRGMARADSRVNEYKRSQQLRGWVSQLPKVSSCVRRCGRARMRGLGGRLRALLER